jgi:hypothetical protein
MKPVALNPFDQTMLRQRSLVETVIDELKKSLSDRAHPPSLAHSFRRQSADRPHRLWPDAQPAQMVATGRPSAFSVSRTYPETNAWLNERIAEIDDDLTQRLRTSDLWRAEGRSAAQPPRGKPGDQSDRLGGMPGTGTPQPSRNRQAGRRRSFGERQWQATREAIHLGWPGRSAGRVVHGHHGGEQLCSRSSIFRDILMFWIPRNTRFDDGVHNRQHLVHASDQGDLFELPVGQQPFIEGLDHRVVPYGTQRRHV